VVWSIYALFKKIIFSLILNKLSLLKNYLLQKFDTGNWLKICLIFIQFITCLQKFIKNDKRKWFEKYVYCTYCNYFIIKCGQWITYCSVIFTGVHFLILYFIFIMICIFKKIVTSKLKEPSNHTLPTRFQLSRRFLAIMWLDQSKDASGWTASQCKRCLDIT